MQTVESFGAQRTHGLFDKKKLHSKSKLPNQKNPIFDFVAFLTV
jgi:hypothetical protein